VYSGGDGFSVLDAFLGKALKESHEYLYWDYGHTRQRYDQAVRLDDWKGIRHGVNGSIQLYDLNNDLGEKNDVASEFPEVVKSITRIMDSAAVPNSHYSIGDLYTGSPIWQRSDYW